MKQLTVLSPASGNDELTKIFSAAAIKRQTRAKIPARARLQLPTNEITEQEEKSEKKGIICPPSCCDAGRLWCAGFSLDYILENVSLPCSREKAEKCKALWDLQEKLELYESQSVTAKHGAATLLRHLGEVRLGQNAAPVEDPGIGDIIFGDDDAEKEN